MDRQVINHLAQVIEKYCWHLGVRVDDLRHDDWVAIARRAQELEEGRG